MSADNEIHELGAHLHKQLVAGDRTATARIAEVFLSEVTDRLRRKYPFVADLHLIETAAEEAFLSYFARPAQYNPNLLSLPSYLLMSARGDLLNLLKKENRISKRQVHLREDVELDEVDSEQDVEIPDNVDVEQEVLVRLSPVWQVLDKLVPDAVDRQIVFLLLEGERDTETFAEVLGIRDLAPDLRAAIVKRTKDRLKKRISRHLDPTELKQDE